MGGYVTLGITAGFTDNYYYGIRRFPYAVKTNVGANTKPHNPLTYADIDTAQIDLTDGAYARGPIGSATANEVHNLGEVWAMMLLEVRARIIGRMGWATGNPRALQVVTDGMKLDPVGPIFLDARNSTLAADCAGFAGADEMDSWGGFATRGRGFGATSSGTSTVTESFALPNLSTGTITFTDSSCNNNGFADPNENLTFTVPLTNPFCAASATSTTATVDGNLVSYGTITAGATVSQPIPYHVPAGALCGSQITIPVVINSSLGPVTRNFVLQIGQPVVGITESFDVIISAGNVMTFLAPSTRVQVLSRLRSHLNGTGRAVIGFGAGRDYEYSQFFDNAADAGLIPDVLLSAWDLRPFSDDSEFLVAILRPA
jgi:hypothetical protein